MNLDDLCQRAADNSTARHAALLDAIQIAAEAMRMGFVWITDDDGQKKRVGAVSKVAEHIHYKANTVKKLSTLEGLPPELVDLDSMPGMYWVAIHNTESFEEYKAVIKQALAKGVTTPGGMKRLLGIDEEKDNKINEVRRLDNQKAEVAEWDIISGPDGYGGTEHFGRVELWIPGWQPSGEKPQWVQVTVVEVLQPAADAPERVAGNY